MKGVNCNNSFLCSILFIIFILMFLGSIISCVPPISLIFKVLLIANKLNCLIFSHHLTEKSRRVHFWMVNEHYFLLYATSVEGSTSNEFISKIHLNLSEIFFDAFSIVAYNGQCHRIVLSLLNMGKDIRLDHKSVQSQLLTLILRTQNSQIFELFLQIFYNRCSLARFLTKNPFKISLIRESVSFLEFLIRNQKQRHHGIEEKELFLIVGMRSGRSGVQYRKFWWLRLILQYNFSHITTNPRQFPVILLIKFLKTITKIISLPFLAIFSHRIGGNKLKFFKLANKFHRVEDLIGNFLEIGFYGFVPAWMAVDEVEVFLGIVGGARVAFLHLLLGIQEECYYYWVIGCY